MEQSNATIPFGRRVLRWAKSTLVALGSIALGILAQQWAAIRDSHPWSLYQAAKINDIERLGVRFVSLCPSSCRAMLSDRLGDESLESYRRYALHILLQMLLDKAPRANPAALDRWRQDFLEGEDILTGWVVLSLFPY